MAKEEQRLEPNNCLNNNNNNSNNSNNCESNSCLTPLRSNLSNGKEVSRSSSPGLQTTVTNRISLKQLSSEKRAKRLKFYLNGDKFFKGFVYVFNCEKVRTFDAICEELTRVLAHHIRLPAGVRFIYSIDGTQKVCSLEQLHEGMSYVCSSSDNYIRLDYESISNMNGICNDSAVNLKNGNNINIKKTLTESNNNHQPQQQHLNLQPTPHQTSSLSSSSSASPTPKVPDFIRPKLVTVIRNGVKPRKAVRILLNRKTAQTYDQVLSEITNAIRLDCGAVRKIFTLGGKQVSCLADFFSDDDVFIAYGLEKYSHEDLDLDSEECKYLNSKTSSLSRNACNRTTRKVSSPLSVIYGSGCLTNGKAVNFTQTQNSPKISSKTNDSNSKNVALNDCNFNGNGYSVCILFPKEVVHHYEIGQIIGDGNFAVVHECVHKSTRIQFALKIIDKSKCKGKEAMIASEVAILRKVKHSNIIQLIEDFDYTNELYLVMELVKGGDLFDAITLANKYTEKDASQMIYNLANALSYLHSLNIVHRDVKPENLLICEHEDGVKSLKLGDFGLAVEIEDQEKLYSVCGTPTYVAPEILAETGYGKEVDIWAAGVIAYILLCGFPPFANEDNDQDLLFDQILSGCFEFTKPFWDSVSESAKELITHMLEVEPSKRYTAYEVMRHQWVAGDIAGTNDMLISVSQKLSVHFDKKSNIKKSNNNNNCSNSMAGISLIARTALDKKPIENVRPYTRCVRRGRNSGIRFSVPLILPQKYKNSKHSNL